MAYALAISVDRPVMTFDTPSELARAILDRPNGYRRHTLHVGACSAAPGENVIAVYGQGERTGFVGYAVGFGHDRAALQRALDEALQPAVAS